MDMMVYLKNVSAASRHVLTILQGEALIGTCIAFMLHNLLVEAELRRTILWWQYVKYLVSFSVGGEENYRSITIDSLYINAQQLFILVCR